MNYKKALIKFMHATADILVKKFKIEKTLYFNKKDEEIINNWEEKICEKIFLILVENIIELDGNNLGKKTDPFCILSDLQITSYCGSCLYGFNHGICGSYHADSTTIKVLIKKNRKNMEDIISNDEYVKIIEGIKNEYNWE